MTVAKSIMMTTAHFHPGTADRDDAGSALMKPDHRKSDGGSGKAFR
jgi:hypothetical protein